MMVNRFKKRLKYNYWANDKVWACIESLTEEQFTHPCDYSVGSLHDQVVHMMSAEELWLGRIRDNHSSGTLAQTAEFPTRQAIASHWKHVQQGWFEYVDTLTDADLTQEISFVSVTYGTTFHNERWEGIEQVLNHSTDHRAQILSLIHQVGGETTAQDFIFHTWGV